MQLRKDVLGVLVAGFCLTVGCSHDNPAQTGNTRVGIDPQPAVTAPQAIADSFSVSTPGQEVAVGSKQAEITLKKSSLEKEFLFSGSAIPQQPIPSFHGLKSRVVAFRYINGKLYLLDANAGHQITQTLPQDLVLTEFPVLRQTDTDITFDFNAGMSKIYTDSDMYGEDTDGGTAYNYSLDHMKVLTSFIGGARLNQSKDILVIDQVAQVEEKDDDSGKTDTEPFSFRYYISPYNPDPNFVPVASEGMRTYGYFEVSPQLASDGSSFVRVSHWDVSHPIVYAISANTPKDFRQAITDAVLYWNHIVGQNIVQVIQLNDPKITAPDPDYNIIQWVENDAAGFAYADAQMDPRSGQILHAQVYLTSVFGDMGKVRAEKDLRDDQSGNGTGSKTAKHVTLKGFQGSDSNSIYCRYESRKALKTLDVTLAQNATPLTQAQALKVAQDYVRETLTHEVGHTLGLRHNFAGSLGGNIPVDSRKDAYLKYLNAGHTTDDVRTTTSIMDYELFEESGLMGDQISRQVGDLVYDRQALQHLYFGKTFTSSPVFCTDTDIGKYQDCQQFDAGRSIVEGSPWMVQYSVNTAALALMNQYIQDKVPLNASTRILPVEQVVLNPMGAALTAFQPRFNLYQAFTKKGRLVAVEDQFPFVSSLNQLAVNSAETDYLKQGATQMGGMALVFPIIPDDFSATQMAKFSQLLENSAYNAAALNGKSFSFSDTEKPMMLTNAKLYMDRMQEYLIKLDLISLLGVAEPKDPSAASTPDAAPKDSKDSSPAQMSKDVSAELLPVITDRVERYVFAISDKTLDVTLNLNPPDDAKPNDPVKTINAKIPVFKYSFEIRMAAAQLLIKGHSEDMAWGFQERTKYSEKLVDLLTTALGAPVEKLDSDSFNHDVTLWIMQNQQVLKAFSNDDK